MQKNSISKPNGQFITAIRGLYFSMQFLGIWPQMSSQKWYKVIWYVQSAGIVFQTFGPTAGMIVQRHDARKLINNLGIVIPIGCICFKWFTFAMYRGTVKTIIHSLEQDWINLDKNVISRSVPDSKRIMATYSKFAALSFYTYVVILTLAIANYLRDSIAARSSENNSTDFDKVLLLPNSWYPLDYNRSFNIQLLLVIQTITTSTFSLANASTDAIFVTATLHVCGQFKILRHFIQGITNDPVKPENCTTKVRLMIQRHQVLLKLSENIQKSYSFIIFEELVACTLGVCFLGYAIIVELESDNANVAGLLQFGSVCLSLQQTVLAYCLVGDHLTRESLAVAMAVYNSPWYNCTRSVNLTFSIVMIRAMKPVEITGAKLLPMSLESFTVLMKASASYLSVLRAMGVGVQNTSEN